MSGYHWHRFIPGAPCSHLEAGRHLVLLNPGEGFNGEPEVEIGTYDADEDAWYFGDDRERSRISHWMPLPEPPRS